ncbi:carbohydrate ABC transporter permease [Kineosporia succinea]|uniref:N,N'-diacetylchitobiose transport system permease protein n=1 Tax=Kineosporia succinea TaxID=84632 RepID=A0ABT9P6Q4_9ACTN|nr:carbohydrate ABC transporter permease [Kineosporia succinea]MDP9828122.1 N,N'-diacetylchitobiose transport system permease protein [Kineosporia succinea]
MSTTSPTRPRTAPTRPKALKRSPSRKRKGDWAANAAALVVVLIMLFPVYWMINTSFQRGVDIQSDTPNFLPWHATLNNYRKAFEQGEFTAALRNSLTVTLITVAAALLLALLAAVALTRFRFRGRIGFIVTVLIVQMVPAEAMVISLFKVLDGWQLVNTVIGLALVYLVFVLPFTIWTLRGFVAGVPVELEEAAMVDGCSRFQAFRRITFPLMAPGLVATGTFAFIQAWNEFTFALVLMNKPENQTLPVWLQTFNEGAKGTDWGGVMAGSTLMAIPVIVFFMLVQSRMTEGLVAGAVKG